MLAVGGGGGGVGLCALSDAFLSATCISAEDAHATFVALCFAIGLDGV
jgi:hypothetical protein